MYFYFLIVVHITLCVALICLVLLQQGKGADLGAVFGNSNSIFGAGGAGESIGNVTRILALLFMVTSILLVREYTHSTNFNDPNAIQEEQPVDGNKALKGSVLEEVNENVAQEENKDEATKEENVEEKANEAGEAAAQEATQEGAKEEAAPAPESAPAPEGEQAANQQ